MANGWKRISGTAMLAGMLLMSAAATAADYSSAEAALRALETAYMHEDLEAAVAAKDFDYEARAMLQSRKPLENPDVALVKQTAEVLELAFRKQIKLEGFPDFRSLACSIVKKTALQPDLVELVEECVSTNGDKSRDILHAAKTARGWRVVVLPR